MNFWEGFWDVIWIFFWSFAFVAYLFAIFAVITDLFRDHALNGWYKAAWVLALIFVPFLTVLVYVIARGEGMARRNVRSQAQAKAATDDYIRDVAGVSPSEEIRKAKVLLDSGAITPAEYEGLKASALRQGPSAEAAAAASSAHADGAAANASADGVGRR